MSKFQSPQFAIYSESPNKFLSHLGEGQVDFVITDFPYVYEFPAGDWVQGVFRALKSSGYFGVLVNVKAAESMAGAATTAGFVHVISPNLVVKDCVCNMNSGCFLLFRKGPLLSPCLEKFHELDSLIVVRHPDRDTRDSLTDFLSSCILKFSLPGDVVADPFCSVGDVGFAAVRLGRRFIGNQVEYAWSNLARDRLVDGQAEMIKLMKRGEV